jgi:hypothetical protein
MAFFDTTWYLNSVGWTAVTAWSAGATIAAGTTRRQTAPAVNSERVFVAIVGGTTAPVTEPTWVITRGGKTTDNTVTWQECTGASAVNGDLTNTPNWTTVKGLAVTLGQIIQRNTAPAIRFAQPPAPRAPVPNRASPTPPAPRRPTTRSPGPRLVWWGISRGVWDQPACASVQRLGEHLG